VVFISLVEGISQTEQLAAAVRSGPLDIDVEFPFHPHVTIAHHLPDDQMDLAFDELAEFDATFDVRGFHLYVHDDVAGWQPTHDFSLPPAAGS
jgi:2'-5' RNA ligase